MGEQKLRVLLVCTHPTQYGSPMWRLMAQRPDLEILVGYCSLEGAEAHVDPGFGADKCLPSANVHAIPWREAKNLGEVIANLDVGFMPYDCYSNKNFHCMPLKVFDYFHAGLPVVSTPIVNLWEYSDTIYFGDDADGLCRAVQFALDEPADSPKKSARIAIAEEHSIEGLAKRLRRVLLSVNKVTR